MRWLLLALLVGCGGTAMTSPDGAPGDAPVDAMDTGARGLDPSFGSAGTASVDLGDWNGSYYLESQLDATTGNIDVAIAGKAAANAADQGSGELVVLHLSPDGALLDRTAIPRAGVIGEALDGSDILVWDASTLARVHADGSADATFHPIALSPFESLSAIAPDGALYLSDNNGTLLRYLADGTPDTTFGTNGQVQPGSLTDELSGPLVQPDGRLVVIARHPEAASFALIGLTAAGAPDVTFANHGMLNVGFLGVQVVNLYGVWIDPTGRAITSLNLWNNPQPVMPDRFQRYRADGTVDASFTYLPQTGVPETLLFQPDGTILAGGFRNLSEGARFWLARYQADGQLDPTFGVGGQLETPIDGHGGGIDQLIQLPDRRLLALGSLGEEGEASPVTHVTLELARYLAP